MHTQIVTFTLEDLTEAGYVELCEGLTAAYARLPGLMAKVWLADVQRNTYGGVYFWRDQASMEEYLASDILRTVAASPHIQEMDTNGFAVYEHLTRLTQPECAIASLLVAG